MRGNLENHHEEKRDGLGGGLLGIGTPPTDLMGGGFCIYLRSNGEKVDKEHCFSGTLWSSGVGVPRRK